MKYGSFSLLVFLLPACRSAGGAPGAAVAAPSTELPASALAGAVRAIETLDAVRPEGTLSQLRAIEAERMVDPTGRGEVERVFLYLTVYAPTGGRAREAFDELRQALESEARASGRAEPAPAARVRRAFVDLDWDPPGQEDLVSYSDTIRLVVRPGYAAPAHAADAGGSATGGEAEPRESLESYVRRRADEERIGAVDIDLSGDPRMAGGPTHVRCRIEPFAREARFSRAQIAGFLSALEGGSPTARLTQVRIERSQYEADVRSPNGWTFSAELSVRAQEPRAAPAGMEAASR